MTAPTRDAVPEQILHPHSESDGFWWRLDRLTWLGYWGIHVAALGVFLTDFSWSLAALALATFWLRLLGITAGYHRYFAHRSYRTSRAFQLALAWLGCSALQKGPLWWAGNHRHHHRASDTPEDLHSPRDGFLYSHYGWIFDVRAQGTPEALIRDFTRFPELVWLNRWHIVPPFALAVLCWAIAGWPGVIWGFAFSTTALWHATYSINSLAHVWGRRRYDTPDDSRNNWVLALLTCGEGWHNNHHHYMGSARNGFYWWEVDVTWYVLRALAACGVVWNLKEVPTRIRDAHGDATTEG